jgi:hypothetical protein
LEDELEFHELESTFGRVIDGRYVLNRFVFERDYPEQEHRKACQYDENPKYGDDRREQQVKKRKRRNSYTHVSR